MERSIGWKPPFRVVLDDCAAAYLVVDAQGRLVMEINAIRLGPGTNRYTMAEDLAEGLNENHEFPHIPVEFDYDKHS